MVPKLVAKVVLSLWHREGKCKQGVDSVSITVDRVVDHRVVVLYITEMAIL